MDNAEIAKEITVAMISRITLPDIPKDNYDLVKWIGNSYKLIYKAVYEAPKEHPNMQMNK